MELDTDLKNRKRKLISINRKIILSFSIPIFIFILVFYIIINIVFREKFEAYVTYKQEETIEKVDIKIHKAYLNDKWNKSTLIGVGDELLSKGILLEILGKDQKYIYSIIKEDEYKCEKVFLDILNNMKKVKPLWVGNLTSKVTPIYDDENMLIGYKKLTYYDQIVYMSEELIFISTINKILVIVAIISLFSILFMTILISKHISYPIKKVSQITRFIGEGNYKQLEYDGNIIEVDHLINSINNLSSSLESQEHIRSRLITDLSHELSNPMTSIHGHLRAIIDGIWEPSKDRLVSIDQELLRIIELIDKLKNLNKLEKDPLNIENTNLKNVTENVINNLEASALCKNIKIEHELEDLNLDVDKNKLSQVLVNIISNSIKYSYNNTKIFVKLNKINDKVYICVSDNGKGIPKKDLPYIFERFYRVDKSKSDNSEGLGVGLTISKVIVNEHGGEIKVSSDVNKGSQFTIILPTESVDKK